MDIGRERSKRKRREDVGKCKFGGRWVRSIGHTLTGGEGCYKREVHDRTRRGDVRKGK